MHIKIGRRKIVDYIEKCHLSDGGYFFAKIGPSSGLDTYLAVKTLRLLGARIGRAGSVASFWDREKDLLNELFGIFLAAETYKELGRLEEKTGEYRRRLRRFLNEFGFGRLAPPASSKGAAPRTLSQAMIRIDIMGKDLQSLYYFTVLSRYLKMRTGRKAAVDAVLAARNKNGGFGCGGRSHLMTTYHALSILDILSFRINEPERTHDYLLGRWKRCDYLEDVFYIVESLELLGGPLPPVERIVRHVESCQRKSGGFSRSRVIGIPTIEDTYYAVRLLRTCERRLRTKILA